MARQRMVKPEFFVHEDLAELSPAHRLLFIGLWTQADKEGRLEDRPKRLKVALCPWDDCDMNAMLADLARAGFIVRYEADGVRCIVIPAFIRHQRPHPKEPGSLLPGPDAAGSVLAVERNGSPVISGQPPVFTHAAKRNGEPWKETADPSESFPSESESESDSRAGAGEVAADDSEAAQVEAFALAQPDVPEPDPDALQRLWNQNKPPEWPEWRGMSRPRADACRARLRDRPLYGTPDSWEAVVKRAARSSFAKGVNERRWRADPEWLLRPDTADRVLEGKYDDRPGTPAAPKRPKYGDSLPVTLQPWEMP